MKAPGSENYLRLKQLMRGLGLNTVCEEARCPNIGECWHHGTATFMILGDVCTRACGYCAVVARQAGHARPRRAGAGRRRRRRCSACSYVVITSVDRDDLADGGAAIFAETIRLTRDARARCRIEVLIPDFQGKAEPLQTVLDAGPDVLNHNTETVPRLYRIARSGGRYRARSNCSSARARTRRTFPTKTGLMVGLGEECDELVEVLRDLRGVGVDILTIGQYLRPTDSHLPMTRYYTPDEFARAEAHRARPRLRPRRIGSARPQLVPRARTGRHARRGRRGAAA